MTTQRVIKVFTPCVHLPQEFDILVELTKLSHARTSPRQFSVLDNGQKSLDIGDMFDIGEMYQHVSKASVSVVTHGVQFLSHFPPPPLTGFASQH